MQGKSLGMGHRQRKECARCRKSFLPTGRNCKRCEPCRKEHHLEVCKKRWHSTYVKKGHDQAGPRNNAWKGGVSPAYYRKVGFAAHGGQCARCSVDATLVHHKNGNRSDSSPGNLEPLCKRCHQLEHDCAGNLPKQVVFKLRTCVICHQEFVPTGPRGARCGRLHAKV